MSRLVISLCYRKRYNRTIRKGMFQKFVYEYRIFRLHKNKFIFQFTSYSSAKRAVEGLNNRYFAGFPIFTELSPVDNFRDAVCRQHDNGECTRGGFCNFLHIKHISTKLEDRLDERSVNFSTDEESSMVSDSEYESSVSSRRGRSSSRSSKSFSDSSDGSESTLTSEDQNSEDSEVDSKVPKAFRTKPLKLKSPDSSPGFEENEFAKEYLQTGRRLRWKIFQKKLLEETWDDAKERQYVFNLLDLT